MEKTTSYSTGRMNHPYNSPLLQPLDYLGSKAGGPVKGDLQPQFLYEEIV